MNEFIKIAVTNFTVLLIFMIVGWIISLINKKSSIADRMWGVGFIIVVWLTFYLSEGFNTRKLILASLATIWGVRLFIYITMRSWGKPEDPRYTAWRDQHGKSFWIVSLFKVFIIQAFFLFAVSFGLQYGIYSDIPAEVTVFDIAGTAVWLFGITFEAVADWQLLRFTGNPDNRGKIMKEGLWSFTRHPNYFGESTLWWGIFIIILSTPYGFITVISPVLITYTLLKVSGVTMMESVEFSSNPEYREYMKSTNAFLPGFKK